MGVTPKLMEYWKRYSPQLFVTASHATQFNLEMPFGKGLIVSGNNRFYALDKKQFREFTTFCAACSSTERKTTCSPSLIELKRR